MNKNKNRVIIDNIFIAVIAAVVVVLTGSIIGKCFNPFVFNDEIGYWTHAAVMAGYDWSGISDGLAWYSFGYSFLLVPLMKIFHDPVMLYKSALWLNVMMNLAVYFMYIRIARFIFPKLDKILAVIISCVSVLYTSYQFNTGVTLSETALLFVTTLIILVLVLVLEKPSFLNLGALGLLCAYDFMVHNRCVGIVASVCLVVAAGVYFRKIPLKKSFAFFVMLAAGFILNLLIKHNLEALIWASGKSTGNDSGSIIDKIRRGFSSLSSLKSMISVFASQFFAVAAATFGLAWFALWRIFVHITEEIPGILKNRKSGQDETDGRIYVLLFIFCAFISTWMISAVFMFDYTRIDHLVYTRYYDIAVGPLIMCGLAFMNDEKKSDNIYLLIMPLFLLAGANRAKALTGNLKDMVFNKVCSPGLCWFYEKIKTEWYGYAIVTAAVFGILMLIMKIKKKNAGLVLSSLFLGTVFTVAVPFAREAILDNQEYYAGDRELMSYAETISDAEYRVDSKMGTFISFFQYMMPDREIMRMSPEDENNENIYFFANTSDRVVFSDYESVFESDNHIMYRNRLRKDMYYELPLSSLKTFDDSLYIAETDDVRSNPSSNYVCYGPYCTFPEGSYELKFDIDFESINTDNIGYIEVKSTSQNTVYNHIEISGDMIEKDGSFETSLAADFAKSVPDVEIIVFLYDPSQISMILNSIMINTEE